MLQYLRNRKKRSRQGQAQPATEEEFYYHKVAPKQTLFSIAKQYGITANDLIRNNPELTKGIVPGQVLKIPVSITNVEAQKANDIASSQIDVSEYSVHPVVSGETLYSLEQRYGISHDDMMKFNPALQNGLKAGMKLKIPAKKAVATVEPVFVPSNAVLSKYKVEKGETLFSLAARFGVDVSEIKKANPSLFSRSLETGEIISIPQQSSGKNQNSGKTEPSQTIVATEINSEPLQDCDPANAKKTTIQSSTFTSPVSRRKRKSGINKY